MVQDSGTAALTYSNVRGGWPGTGNVDADPLFAGGGSRPYSLRAGSPCVDSGDPAFASVPCAKDLIGACRVWDGNGDAVARVDMGAYEFGSLLGDIDGDCVIGAGDLRVLMKHFNTAAGATYAQGDIDGDSDVDGIDLHLLLAVLGWRCP